ncbi:MAG TPA: hypothetical protein VJ805_01320 [Nitrospiraceae bacterium]|nr:hypothetical protein [Nitrospiraceae bacterium]
MIARNLALRCWAVLALAIMAAADPAFADTTIEGRGNLFYTDDVGIFSATRRLTRDGDPTQPALDTSLTDKGSDVVFEPDAKLSTGFDNRFGKTDLSIRGQGFIYADNARFNHGTMTLQAIQSFSPETHVRLRYYYVPNMFLGDNEDRRPGREGLVDETLTSHIWSARVEQRLTQTIEAALLTRYGIRRYNDAFAQRDLDFWTIGPHVQWRLSQRLKVGLSYHFERGLADGRHQPEFMDDVSYINHYVSADLDIEVTERWSLWLAFHYERNNWTSGIVGDERRGAHEDIYQGEAVLIRKLTETLRAYVGFQRSSRKQSFEAEHIKNTNVAIGVAKVF